MSRGPRPLVICGPSGSGKTTLLKRLFAEFPSTFDFSVSHTTRPPRPGEENGIHYNFVTREEMQAAIDRGELIQSATFNENVYGTSHEAVYHVQARGKVCVFDISIQGVEQIRNSDLNPILVFILPPSISELESRLRGRNTETESTLQKRLKTAEIEIAYGKTPGNFHAVIDNVQLNDAYRQLRDFVLKEMEAQIAEGIIVNLRRKCPFAPHECPWVCVCPSTENHEKHRSSTQNNT